MRKITRKSLIKHLDKVTSEIVRLRDKSCVLCGTQNNLTAGHVFSRTNYSTRWDLSNQHCQCASCNFRHEHDPWPYFKWFIARFGQGTFDELYDKHHSLSHFKDYQLLELYEGFKIMLKDYQNDDSIPTPKKEPDQTRPSPGLETS